MKKEIIGIPALQAYAENFFANVPDADFQTLRVYAEKRPAFAENLVTVGKSLRYSSKDYAITLTRISEKVYQLLLDRIDSEGNEQKDIYRLTPFYAVRLFASFAMACVPRKQRDLEFVLERHQAKRVDPSVSKKGIARH